MSTEAATMSESTIGDVRRICVDLFAHDARLYWLDLLGSAIIGWGFFALAVHFPAASPMRHFAILVAAVALLRAVLFIHELSHFRRGVLPGFALVWNLLVGIPLCLPSFMYVGTHTDHHKRHLYGTIGDPEYLPLALLPKWRTVKFLVEVLLVPALLVLRFAVLFPLSLLLPPLRRLVVSKLSTLVINPDYTRRMPEPSEHRRWIALESGIFVVIAAVTVGVSTGHVPLDVPLVWLETSIIVAVVNQVRTLAAHRFENDGERMSTTEQLLDSFNITGAPLLTELAAPVGLRFHALHHLVPDMPYHSLPEAHRRLSSRLPSDAAYRRVEIAGFADALRYIWKHARTGRSRPEQWRSHGAMIRHEEE